MRTLGKLTGRFMHDARGTTAIEYGMIAALIAVIMLAGLQALSSGTSGSWSATANSVSTAMQDARSD